MGFRGPGSILRIAGSCHSEKVNTAFREDIGLQRSFAVDLGKSKSYQGLGEPIREFENDGEWVRKGHRSNLRGKDRKIRKSGVLVLAVMI